MMKRLEDFFKMLFKALFSDSENNVIDRRNRVLQYDLDNDPNRDNMYSIFKENKQNICRKMNVDCKSSGENLRLLR